MNSNHEDNLKRFDLVTTDMRIIYSKKNQDYGNSFDKSLDEDGLLVAKIRMMDKLHRFAQLIRNPQKVKGESIRDTLVDLANYSVMTVKWMDEKEEMAAILEAMSIGADLDGDIIGGKYVDVLQPSPKTQRHIDSLDALSYVTKGNGPVLQPSSNDAVSAGRNLAKNFQHTGYNIGDIIPADGCKNE